MRTRIWSFSNWKFKLKKKKDVEQVFRKEMTETANQNEKKLINRFLENQVYNNIKAYSKFMTFNKKEVYAKKIST